MTNAKKLVAVVLALIMAFSCVSVMASAVDAGGNELTMITKIFRNNGMEWVETEDVMSGETVKARVYLGTDFSAIPSDLLFYFDNRFFSYDGSVTVNTKYADAPYKVTAYAYPESATYKWVDDLALTDAATVTNYDFIYVMTNLDGVAKKYYSNTWFLEFDLTVEATAGQGTFKVCPETFASPANQDGVVNIIRAPEDAKPNDANCEHMWDYNVNLDVDEASSDVMIMDAAAVTFDANGGKIKNEDSVTLTGAKGSDLTAPVPSNGDKEFLGWAVESSATTGSQVTKFPNDDTATYFAVWSDAFAGSNLAINTRWFREVDGNWVETETVKKGDTVKARVYVATDYPAGGSEFILFYDNDFFESAMSSTSGDIVTASEGYTDDKNITGSYYIGEAADPIVSSLVSAGMLDAAFAEQYDAVYFTTLFADSSNKNCAKAYDDAAKSVDAEVDDDNFIAEFTFTVADSASGSANLFVVPETIIRPYDVDPDACDNGIINVPKGSAELSDLYADGMWLWNVNFNADPDGDYFRNVTLGSKVTFEAFEGDTPEEEYGYFTDGTTALTGDDAYYYTVIGDVGSIFRTADIPAVERDGYAFLGWYDASITNPDVSDILDEIPDTIGYEEVTYKAYWVASVDITFDTGDGTQLKDITDAVPGAEFNKLLVTTDNKNVLEPALEGYTFVGWSTNSNGSNPAALPDVYPNADTTYYAVWEVNTYLVNYYVIDKSNKLEVTKLIQLTCNYDAEINQSVYDVYGDKGYDFDGWYYDATCKKAVAANAKMPAKNIDLYAMIDYAEIKSIFDANGGKFSDDTTSKDVYTTYKSNIVAPEDPTWEEHVFKGWTPAVSTQTTSDVVTYKATWDEATYTVTFYSKTLDEGTGEYVYSVYDIFTGYAKNAPMDPLPAAPYIEGKTFIDWSLIPDDTNGIVDIPERVNADASYYAIFSDNEYTIEYFNESDTAYKSDAYIAGAAVTVADNPTHPQGAEKYSFDGWEWKQYNPETSLFDIDLAEAPAKMPAANIQATAKYTENKYTVSFYADAGDEEPYDTQELGYGAEISLPDTDPAKPGYTFQYWKDENDEEVDENNLPTVDSTQGRTFVAEWKKESYTIKWYKNADDATFGEGDTDTYKTTSVDFDDPIVPTTDEPTRDGYQLIGWSTEDDATAADASYGNASADAEFYAVWAPDSGVEYWLYIYVMDTDGNYPAQPNEKVKHTDGEVGKVITLTYTTSDEKLSLDTSDTDGTTEKSVLTGTIPSTGTLILKAYLARNRHTFTANYGGDTPEKAVTEGYLVGATITDPAVADEPVKTGYTFKGWTTTKDDGSTMVTLGVMPDDDLTVYAYYEIQTHDAIFNAGDGTFAGGSSTVTTPVEYGSAIEKPADNPTRPGYTFGGWATEADPDTAITEWPARMDTDDVEYVAIWEESLHKVTYWTPERDATEGENYGKFKEEWVASESFDDVAYGTNFNTVRPTKDPDPIDYYEFKGWSTTKGGAVIASTEWPATMPDEDVNFYAVFERLPVYLIKKSNDASCTTVIDRGEGYYGSALYYTIENQQTFTRNTQQTYDQYTDSSVWYVYGLKERVSLAELDSTYLAVNGDGHYEVEPVSKSSVAGAAVRIGTGAVIKVIDNVTGNMVESFYVVIMGDINGDGACRSVDVTALELDSETSNSFSNDLTIAVNTAKMMAADINRNNHIRSADVTCLERIIPGLSTVNQATGAYTELT